MNIERMHARRECVNCGRLFRIPIKCPSNPRPSKRRTCGRRCANELRSWAMVQAHRQLRLADPGAYRRWQHRDYAAMALLAVAARKVRQ